MLIMTIVYKKIVVRYAIVLIVLIVLMLNWKKIKNMLLVVKK